MDLSEKQQVDDPLVQLKERLTARRVVLVGEQGKAVQALQAAEQQAMEMRALLERLAGAIMVIDELLNTGDK